MLNLIFIVGLLVLLIGYKTYANYVEKQLEPDVNRTTPAFELRDDVDYVPLGDKKNKLIQLLNIAGTGPIYGPIAGAVFGPIGLLIIPFGNIFMGATHDFVLGIISMRNKGNSVPKLATKYLGDWSKYVILIFSALLLMLVGTVFVTSPAELIHSNFNINYNLILAIIFIYYIISTVTPIDKIIGRIYPFITAILLVGTSLAFISVIFMQLTGKVSAPMVTVENFLNWNPTQAYIIPGFFVMVSCGLISGFHATQIPIVAKTTQNEGQAKSTFYGMMVTEGVIAMIWCYVTILLFNPETIASTSQPVLIGQIAEITLGAYLSWILILAVIILPVTSGDTAFRSLRMIIAESFNVKQKTMKNRILLALPIFIMSLLLITVIDFSTLWLYFTWSNHMLAVVTLLIGASYLYHNQKNYLIMLIPAIILFIIDTIYLLEDQKIGFGIANHNLVTVSSIIIVLILTGLVTWKFKKVNLEN